MPFLLRGTLLFLLTACASRTQVRPIHEFSGVVPLQLTVRGSQYTGSVQLSPSTTDSLLGSFTATGPVTVVGSIRGLPASGQLDAELTYAVAANGCKGTMRLRGPVDSVSRKTASGSIEATDSCVGRMTGTFRIGQ